MGKQLFLVTDGPHITKNYHSTLIMLMVILSLVPAIVAAAINFGAMALLVLLVSVVSFYGFDIGFNYLFYKKYDFTDISSLLSGLLFGMTLPVSVPLYYPVIGALFAVLFIKMLFGGTGKNLFNPAASARALLGVLFAGFSLTLFTLTADGASMLSPITYFADGDYSAYTLTSMFLGSVPGGVGTTSILCLAIGALWLIIAKVIDYKIPLFAIIGFVAITICFKGAIAILPFIMTGSFFFAAIYMATDYVSSPSTEWGSVVYGLIFGVLSALFRVFGILGETGVFVALLIVNSLSPLLDKMFQPRPIGWR